MKAIVWTKYGSPDGLILKEVDTPKPKDNEVLIKIHATSVFTGDIEMRTLMFPFYFYIPIRLVMGIIKPRGNKILGQEFSGEVIKTGRDVTKFSVGDEIYAATAFDLGGYAEYKTMPEDGGEGALNFKPNNMSFEEAATMPVGGIHAVRMIEMADIEPGQKVLVNGAGGSIGNVIIQLAKAKGAVVTAIDIGSKLDVLASIGADHTIDFTKEDFTKQGVVYDTIFDVAGKIPVRKDYKVLRDGGILILANPKMRHVIRGRLTSLFSSKKIRIGIISYEKDDLPKLTKFIEDGTIRPVIDRTYNLEEMAEAHRYVDSGQKTGTVAVKVVK